MPSKYPMAHGQTKFTLPISPFRRIGDTIYISGHGAVNDTGAFASDTFDDQMEWTMAQFAKTLELAGVTFADVVKVQVYVQDYNDLPLYNRLYCNYFKEPYPARSTLTGCLPPGLLFEIEAIAIAPTS